MSENISDFTPTVAWYFPARGVAPIDLGLEPL
jgi:hypothetical protein